MLRSEITGGYVDAAIAFIDKAANEDKPFYINLWPDDVHSPFWPPVDKWGNGRKRTLYRAVLDTMDEQLGPLFDHVRERDALRDNTLILVCSDNGPEPGAGSAGPFRGAKTKLYEGGIRSPLVVWGPGWINASRAGTVNRSSFWAAIDLVPTLLQVAGVEVTRTVRFDGQALPEVLLGQSQASRTEPLFFRRPPDRDSFYGEADLPDLAVREGRWKLLCEYDGSQAQLYDLQTDPGETNDLASQHPEQLRRLRTLVTDWHRSMPPDKGATFGKGKN